MENTIAGVESVADGIILVRNLVETSQPCLKYLISAERFNPFAGRPTYAGIFSDLALIFFL